MVPEIWMCKRDGECENENVNEKAKRNESIKTHTANGLFNLFQFHRSISSIGHNSSMHTYDEVGMNPKSDIETPIKNGMT